MHEEAEYLDDPGPERTDPFGFDLPLGDLEALLAGEDATAWDRLWGENAEPSLIGRAASLLELHLAWLPGLSHGEGAAIMDLAQVFAGDDRGGSLPVPPAVTLAALGALQDLRAALDLIEGRLVATAVAGGLSWSRIGQALGVSRQATWTRWRPVIEGSVQLVAGAVDRDGFVHVVARTDHRVGLCGAKGLALSHSHDDFSEAQIDCDRCFSLVASRLGPSDFA